MDVNTFNQLLENPIQQMNPLDFEEVLDEFPYFQCARALQLYHFYRTDPEKYEESLTLTAAHTINREVLFDFINSQIDLKESVTVEVDKEEISEEVECQGEEMQGEEMQDVAQVAAPKDDSTQEEQQSVQITAENKQSESLESIEDQDSEPIEKLEETAQKEESTPQKTNTFSNKDKHSFSDWMLLLAAGATPNKVIEEKHSKKDHKTNIINKFIATNPSIQKIDKKKKDATVATKKYFDDDSIMTETLARIYVTQGKYENAIQAYRILRLNYPEKSSFFDDEIQRIKKIKDKK